jgi:2-amino-4-hydroxy-6-hydroxymethyldihydropteridine diphosphokinase
LPLPHDNIALIAFGANLRAGDMLPAETISAAYGWLSGHGVTGLRMSALYATPSFPAGSGPEYVNAAAVVTLRNDWDAVAFLALLHKAEAAFGRERGSRWAGRTLDIDLLAWGDSVLPDAATQSRWRNLPATAQRETTPAELILPHPRLQDRAFVLVPLADVAPDWRHPLLGLTVRQMLAALDPADVAAARRL